MTRWTCSHCSAINVSGAFKCHSCPNTCGDGQALYHADIQEDSYRTGYAAGVRACIVALRELSDTPKHQRKWNSSGTTAFAPVELSDWLLVNVLRRAP